jgi:hypothetical protein
LLYPEKEEVMQRKWVTITVLLALNFLITGNGWGEQKSRDGSNQMMCKLDQPGIYSTCTNDSRTLQQPQKSLFAKTDTVDREQVQKRSSPTKTAMEKSFGFGWGGYIYANDGNLGEVCRLDPATLKVTRNYTPGVTASAFDYSSASMILLHWDW